MGTPTYEELAQICDRLERQVSRQMRVQQQLIDTRAQLDRELHRSRVQHQLHERAVSATVPSELAELCVEALVEAFELEIVLMYLVPEDGSTQLLAQFGAKQAPTALPGGAAMAVPDDNAHLVDTGHAVMEGLTSLDLGQAVVCRVCHNRRPLLMIYGATSRARTTFFPALTADTLAPFGAMAQQVGTVWLNHHLNLAVRERRYSVLFHRSNDAILLVNPEGAIVDCNNKAVELFGYTQTELTQMKVFDLTPAEELDQSRTIFDRLREAGSTRAERTCVTKYGERFPAELNASLFEVDDGVMIHSIIRDLTQEKRAQRQLIESERLVALGQLIAGIAHEINTPIGVILASIGNIEGALGDTLEQLPRMARDLPAQQVAPFFALLTRARQSREVRSSREERALRRATRKELDELGVSEAESLADALVDIGLVDDLSAFGELFREHGQGSVEVAYNLASLRRNSSNIRMAVERANKVVFALKKYVHHDHSGERKPADLIESLNVVLTLYENKLKQGVEVVRTFEELPPVMCLVDELNQVWTNLVHNALQAMQNSGRLEIGAKRAGDSVLVSVIDDGPGIDPSVRARIFEPFFTTKASGEGSGLGLDICRRIIERHQGTLWFESRPGRTAFFVSLPLGGAA